MLLHLYYYRKFGCWAEVRAASAQWLRLVQFRIFPCRSEAEIDHMCETIGAVISKPDCLLALNRPAWRSGLGSLAKKK